jgi:hypothetical protein
MSRPSSQAGSYRDARGYRSGRASSSIAVTSADQSGSKAGKQPIFTDTNLVAIPDGVTAEAAASLGCRFATAYRALTGRARLAAGEWVTVIGAGGVGLSSVMIAKALGARVVAAGWADLEQASATFSAPEDQRVRESIQRARALDPRQAIRTTAREMAVLLRLIRRDEAGPAEACAQVRRMMARQSPGRLRACWVTHSPWDAR